MNDKLSLEAIGVLEAMAATVPPPADDEKLRMAIHENGKEFTVVLLNSAGAVRFMLSPSAAVEMFGEIAFDTLERAEL